VFFEALCVFFYSFNSQTFFLQTKKQKIFSGFILRKRLDARFCSHRFLLISKKICCKIKLYAFWKLCHFWKHLEIRISGGVSNEDYEFLVEFLNCDADVWTKVSLKVGDNMRWSNVSACAVGCRIAVFIRLVETVQIVWVFAYGFL